VSAWATARSLACSSICACVGAGGRCNCMGGGGGGGSFVFSSTTGSGSGSDPATTVFLGFLPFSGCFGVAGGGLTGDASEFLRFLRCNITGFFPALPPALPLDFPPDLPPDLAFSSVCCCFSFFCLTDCRGTSSSSLESESLRSSPMASIGGCVGLLKASLSSLSSLSNVDTTLVLRGSLNCMRRDATMISVKCVNIATSSRSRSLGSHCSQLSAPSVSA
jgi:hypothetical protein